MRFSRIMIIFLTGFVHASHFDVLVVGDEISTYYQSRHNNWVTLLKQQCSCSLQIYNSSKAGATSKEGYHSVESFLKRHQSKIAIIELGYNDIENKHRFGEIEKNIDSSISLLKENGTTVVLIGIELPPHFNTIYRQLFKSTYQRLAHKHEIELITSEYTADPNLVELDHIQPNAEGHQTISNSVSPIIEKLACHKTQ